ncbi:Tetratricopeptide repeat containing protein [Gracilaria domingensis]|nr:Tetratricopeptide repeat containing protein [Gracilaria domingensis]
MCPYTPGAAGSNTPATVNPDPSPPQPRKRKPGRPPTYVFSKPDHELSENERRLKGSVIKRRIRQNRSYHRKKRLRQLAASSGDSNSQSPAVSTTDHSTNVFVSVAAPVPPPLQLPTLPSDPCHSARLPSPAPPVPSLSPLPSILPLNQTPFPSSAPFDVSTASTEQSTPRHASQLYISPTNQHHSSETVLDISSRHALSDSNRMVRGAASRPLLAAQLATRVDALPIDQTCLSKLLIFPSTFDAPSALAILNVPFDNAHSLIRSLVDTNLLSIDNSGRYSISPIAKELLSEHRGSHMPEVQRGFVVNYIQKLLSFGPERLHCDGAQRQLAMKLYDNERANMETALRLSQSLHTSAEPIFHRFLSVAATVMRYSVSASTRLKVFRDALELPCLNEERRIHARIRLALGEAYLDLLSFTPAKEHLEAAIADLAMYSDSDDSDLSSMLSLLLLAELRASEREFQHAKSLLSQALQSMRNRSMQRSSYAACCLLTLASVYSAMHEESKALVAVTKAIDVLVTVKFEYMPIYADALRALGCVHFRMGDVDKAQKVFLQGLQIVQDWMARPDWNLAPFQHCAHLDVFLVESVAWTFVKQDRMDDAKALFEQAKTQRRMRHLDDTRCVDPFEDAAHPSCSSERDGTRVSWLYTRHLY